MKKITMLFIAFAVMILATGCEVTVSRTDGTDAGSATFTDSGFLSNTSGYADITLNNNSGYTITEFYIAESTDSEWGVNQVSSVLNGSFYDVVDIFPCDTYYDLKVVDSTTYIAEKYDLYVACDIAYDFNVTATVAP